MKPRLIFLVIFLGGLWFFFGTLSGACGGGSDGGSAGDDGGDESYPYVPDTTEFPDLHLTWDGILDRTTVEFVGAFGVWEGGDRRERANEIEIHLTQSGQPIYALADGVVVDIQAALSEEEAAEGVVEGVWVRYGRNFRLKYVHVLSPTVVAGDVVSAGDRIGTVTDLNGGFWEVQVEVREGESVYADCLYDYADAETQELLLGLWTDEEIGHSYSANCPDITRIDEQWALDSVPFEQPLFEELDPTDVSMWDCHPEDRTQYPWRAAVRIDNSDSQRWNLW